MQRKQAVRGSAYILHINAGAPAGSAVNPLPAGDAAGGFDDKDGMMIGKFAAFALALSATAGVSAAASAAEIEVKMLNKGAEGVMVFEPSFVQVAPGDTVRFVPTDKSHNAESIEGMLPEGAEPFQGKMNEEIAVTFDVPGVYGFKCKPHYAMGMVGLVVVGEPVNETAAAEVPQKGKAKQKFAALFEKVGG
jgi:pseudoazurin